MTTDENMECWPGFGCHAKNRGGVRCKPRSGCPLQMLRTNPMMLANVERAAAQGAKECQVTLNAIEALSLLQQSSISGYVSDKVFDGRRPLSKTRVDQLRRKILA